MAQCGGEGMSLDYESLRNQDKHEPMSNLPEWVQKAAIQTIWDDAVIGKRPDARLLKALSLAWEALESISAYDPSKASRRKQADDAMRRIEEIGK